jgi:hypothetical protein
MKICENKKEYEDGGNCLSTVVFPEEAMLHMSGNVSSYSCHNSDSSPREINTPKLTVLYTFTR